MKLKEMAGFLLRGPLRILLTIFALVMFAVAAPTIGEALGMGAVQNVTDALGNTFDLPSEDLLNVGTGLGVLLLGAWLLGKAAAQLGLSKITGFLLFGILVGPYVLGIVSKGELEYLKLVNDLAIALIALAAGGEMQLGFLKKFAKSILAISILEMSIIIVFITGLMFLMFKLDDSVVLQWGAQAGVENQVGLFVALAIATIAAANSPAVVIAIITETKARGIMAQTGLAVTVAKDLLTIVLFAVVLATSVAYLTQAHNQREAYVQQHPEYWDTHEQEQLIHDKAIEEHPELFPELELVEGDPSAAAQFAHTTPKHAQELAQKSEKQKESIWVYLAKHVPGSMAVGAIVGLLMAFYVIKVGAHLPIVLVLAGFAITLASRALGLEPLIVGLTAGFVMANVYGHALHELFETVEELSMPVYAVFFAVAGTKVNPAVVAEVWHYVLALVLLRACGTFIGCWVGGYLTNMPTKARDWVWASLIPQAGIALVLTTKIADAYAEWPFMTKVFNIMLSAVAVHELFGPVLFKFALGRAGEAGHQVKRDHLE